MMIGPEPIRRIERRSVRRRHQPIPLISPVNSSKRPAASRGPGAASGWYWTEKAGTSTQPHAFQGPVVEVLMGGDHVPNRLSTTPGAGPGRPDPSAPEPAGRQRPEVDREAMVLGGDLDPPSASRRTG